MKTGRRYEKLYNPIINRLEQQELSYSELAEKTNIPRTSIIKLIKEFDNLPLKKLANIERQKSICKVLGLKLKDYI